MSPTLDSKWPKTSLAWKKEPAKIEKKAQWEDFQPIDIKALREKLKKIERSK